MRRERRACTVLQRADPLEPGERRLDRDRRRVGVVDDLAEHVLHLVLAAGRLGEAEGEERERRATGRPSRKNAQRQPSSPPASAAMPPTSAGLSAPMTQAGPMVGGADAGRGPRSGRCRRAASRGRGWCSDLAMPTPNRARNSVKALTARPDRKTISREARRWPTADDRRPPVAVGQPAHRQRAEHEERARRRADEDDHAVADAEGVADVGREHAERRRPRGSRRKLSSRSIDEREAARRRRGPARVISSSPTPGSRSSAKRTSSSACSAWRSASASRTASASDAACGDLVVALTRPPVGLRRPTSCSPRPRRAGEGQNQVLAILERTFRGCARGHIDVTTLYLYSFTARAWRSTGGRSSSATTWC